MAIFRFNTMYFNPINLMSMTLPLNTNSASVKSVMGVTLKKQVCTMRKLKQKSKILL